MQFKANNIVWDTEDEEDADELDLPDEAIIEAEDEFEVADALSDKFGWCVKDLDVTTHFVVAYKLEGDEEPSYFPVWADNAEAAVYKCCDENPEAVWTQVYTPVK